MALYRHLVRADMFVTTTTATTTATTGVVVVPGTWRSSMAVAVKKLTPGQMTKDDFISEAKLLHRLRHRHLVLLLGVCTVDEPMYIIMELLSNGALNDYLRSDVGSQLDFAVLINFSAQVTTTTTNTRPNTTTTTATAAVITGDVSLRNWPRRQKTKNPALARIAQRTCWQWLSRSSKVDDFHFVGKGVCHFLLVINSNLGRVSYRFRHMAGFSLNLSPRPIHLTFNLKMFLLHYIVEILHDQV